MSNPDLEQMLPEAAAEWVRLPVGVRAGLEHAADESGIKIHELTCAKCLAVRGCEFAFHLYNTNGDCLAEK